MLRLDSHGYSRAVLQKIVEAGGEVKSFKVAARLLQSLAEVSISARHVGRLVHEIGTEMAAARDRGTEDYLHHRRQPLTEPAAGAVSVMIDGGRVLTRETCAGQGAGVHGHGWKEDKVACLQVLEGPCFEEDPHPTPPRAFLDAEHVAEMVRDFQAVHGLPSAAEDVVKMTDASGKNAQSESADASATECLTTQAEKPAWPPQRRDRTCLASICDSEAFGKMLAAEAYQRNFASAKRKAFVADGLKYNWTIQQKWFKDFTPIADFIHPLSYLYLAATAVSATTSERWTRYITWMTACWQGRIDDVLTELRKQRERVGDVPPDEELPDSDPRVAVQSAITYLENNGVHMNYPAYRQQGLPVTSAPVESLIKEVNYRVKGTEKFWNHPAGIEAILQVRAALLSSDGRLSKHLKNRPGSPYRYRRLSDTAKTRQAA